MKRLSTLVIALTAVICIQAQGKINLHLTGCTPADDNPTEYTKDDGYVELNLTLQNGYTFAGAEVTVRHGDTELTTDWMDDTGYYSFDNGYLFFSYYKDITEDFDVTVTCQAQQVGPDLPAEFTSATFEDLEIAQNSVYRPATFSPGDNKWLSGAARFNTIVQDWRQWGLGYGYQGIQAVSYQAGTTVTDVSDSYLPSATGAAQGNNYATVNIASAYERIQFTKTTLTGMAVTNTAFNTKAFIQGDGMSEEIIDGVKEKGFPFHQGDWFLLTIKGLNGETVTGTVDFYLADFRTPGQWRYAQNWQWVDLSSLGEVDGLQFELSSTKHNKFGMTTAAYFCIDNLGGQSTDCTLGDMTTIASAQFGDDDAYAVKTRQVVPSATYIRQAANEWGTICLPFAVQSNDDVQYYQLAAATTEALTFTPVTVVAAGQPAVFRKLVAGDLEICASNVTLKPVNKYDTTSQTKAAGWTMYGTLTGSAIQGDDQYFIAQDKFWNAQTETNVKPYRAWFQTSSSDNSRSMVINIADGDATSILTLDGKGSLTSGDVYDLTGRKVSADTKGIVIKGNRLIIR